MLGDIESGMVDAVLVYHLDRLTRRPKELEHFLDTLDAAKLTNCRRSRYPAAQRSSYPPLGPWGFCLLHRTSLRPLAPVDELRDLPGQVVG